MNEENFGLVRLFSPRGRNYPQGVVFKLNNDQYSSSCAVKLKLSIVKYLCLCYAFNNCNSDVPMRLLANSHWILIMNTNIQSLPKLKKSLIAKKNISDKFI